MEFLFWLHCGMAAACIGYLLVHHGALAALAGISISVSSVIAVVCKLKLILRRNGDEKDVQ